MSKRITATYHDTGRRECPYCGHKWHVEAEEYDERARAEECDECGKGFYAYENISVAHVARPDCELNGEEHEWETMGIGNGKTHLFCAKCSRCHPGIVPSLEEFLASEGENK